MRIPWWIFLILAAVAYALLSWLAASPVSKGAPPVVVVSALVKGLASAGKYLVPLVLVCLAIWFWLVGPSTQHGTQTAGKRNRHQRRIEPSGGAPESERTTSRPAPTEVTLDLLRTLEWRRFEEACAEYFRCINFHAITQSHGADGGVDIQLAHIGEPGRIVGLVQCKQWAKPVGPKLMREFLGVMVDAKISEGIFITTSTFVPEARSFGVANKIDLIDGERLVELMNELPATSRERILAVATEGDYMTPTCVACGIKLVRRQGEAGAFWGCSNFPRCRVTMEIAAGG